MRHVLVALAGKPQRVIAEADRRVFRRFIRRAAAWQAFDQRVVIGVAEERDCIAHLAETLRTRCGVDRNRSLVQRCRMSPPLTTKAPSTPGASIHRPFGSRIDNPGTGFGGSNVMNPESVCGTRLATVSSSWSMTGYRDMRRIMCGTAKHASKKSAGKSSAMA